MSSTKRKLPSAAAASLGPTASAGGPGPGTMANKRLRFDPTSATDSNGDGDLDLDEQDRKRNQQGRKGRVITEGYASESSDEDIDGGTHRRNADKKRKAAQDDGDEDIFDLGDDDRADSQQKESKKTHSKYLELGDIEGQEFDSRTRRHEDPSASPETDEEDRDPELELEDSDHEDGDDDDGEEADSGPEAGINALSERTPPTSPGGTPLRNADRPSGTRRAKRGTKGGVKITGFNMKEEMKTGKFDEEGNFIENAKDPHAQHDSWLAGQYSRKKIKAAREAQLRLEREMREKEAREEQEDNDEDELRKQLVEHMMRGESVLETLRRLGKDSKKHGAKNERKVGYRSKNKNVSKEGLNADAQGSKADAAQTQSGKDRDDGAAKALEQVTHLASTLMSKFGEMAIYEASYEQLLQEVRKSGLVRGNFDPASRFDTASSNDANHGLSEDADAKWEYRWSPAYLAAAAQASGESVSPEMETFGPYSRAELEGWAQAGYFGTDGERILIRQSGSNGPWQKSIEFLQKGL